MKTMMTTAAVLLALAMPFTSLAIAEEPILRTLPSDVQEEIDQVRQSCRAIGPATSDYTPPRVSKGDEGLITFIVSGAEAVLVDELNFCGNGLECMHGVNCDAYNFAWLIVADGAPIYAYARLRGIPLIERITGADLFLDLVT